MLAGTFWHNRKLQSLVDQLAEAKTTAENQRDQAEIQRAVARQAVDEMYTGVARQWMEDQPGLQDVQKEFLQKALRYYQEFAREEDPDPGWEQERARAWVRVGEIQAGLGENQDAERAFGNAVPSLEALVQAAPANFECRSDLALSRYYIAVLLAMTGRDQEAGPAFATALDGCERLVSDFPSRPESVFLLARCHHNMGILATTEPKEAITHFRREIALAERLFAQHPTEAKYGATVVAAHASLGRALSGLDLIREAEEALRQAIQVGEQVERDQPHAAKNQQALAFAYTKLAELLVAIRDLAAAERPIRRAAELARRLVVDYPKLTQPRWYIANTLRTFASILTELGHQAEAERVYREALSHYGKVTTDYPTFWGYFQQFARCRACLALLLAQTGRFREAVDEFAQALAALERATQVSRDPDPARWLSWYLSACPFAELRDPARALSLAAQAVEQAPRDHDNWQTLAFAHYRARDWKAALSALDKATALRKGDDETDWHLRAMTQWQQGDKAAARQAYARAEHGRQTRPLGDMPWEFEAVAIRKAAGLLLGVHDSPGR
jgi:tetratricopeptide (TPR) repeat protein